MNDEGTDIEGSFYESDATWEKESNDGSEHSYESEGMNSFSKFENENAFQFLHCTN